MLKNLYPRFQINNNSQKYFPRQVTESSLKYQQDQRLSIGPGYTCQFPFTLIQHALILSFCLSLFGKRDVPGVTLESILNCDEVIILGFKSTKMTLLNVF